MATTPVFDPIAYIRDKNEREAAARQNKTIEAKPVPALPAIDPAEAGKGGESGAEEPVKPHEAGLNRRERRRLAAAEAESARLQGELKAIKEMMAAGVKKEPETPVIDPNKKPERKDFASDAEFADAISQFNAKKVGEQTEQSQQIRDRINSMASKAQEDYALIPEWEAHAKAAAEDDRLDFDPSANPQFWMLMGLSEYQAVAMDYFTQNPDEFVEMVDIKDPGKLHAEFGALEGHLKRVYSDLRKKAAASEKKAETTPAKVEAAPERKKLPVPSEAVAPRGGSVPNLDVPPVLEGGKINPAWVEQRNQRLGLKR